MKFNKPTISLENFTKEIQNIFTRPFTGIKSSLSVNGPISLTVENINLKSNLGFLYSTSNFLSSVFFDNQKNVIFKNILVKNDFVGKSTILLNKEYPIGEMSILWNKIINSKIDLIFNKELQAKTSFILKSGNTHFGAEVNLKNKYDTSLFFQVENLKSIFAAIVRYDLLNLGCLVKINDYSSVAGELVVSDLSIFSRIGLLITSHCTDLRIEINSMMSCIMAVDKKILENFVVSVCTEMKNGSFETGIGLNLEF